MGMWFRRKTDQGHFIIIIIIVNMAHSDLLSVSADCNIQIRFKAKRPVNGQSVSNSLARLYSKLYTHCGQSVVIKICILELLNKECVFYSELIIIVVAAVAILFRATLRKK